MPVILSWLSCDDNLHETNGLGAWLLILAVTVSFASH